MRRGTSRKKEGMQGAQSTAREKRDSVSSLYEPLPTVRVEGGDDNSIFITQKTPPHVLQCDEGDDSELFNKPKTPTYVPKHGMVELCVQSPGIGSQTMQHGGFSQTSHNPSGAWRSEFLDDCAKSDQLLRAHSTKRCQELTRSQTQTKRPKNIIASYYGKKSTLHAYRHKMIAFHFSVKSM